ncbi:MULTISPECIES: hypothetical protein [Acinetobacter]|uniref:Uncharacterized protein n=1 Tax=Acinetobacter pittii TaxID=48296 RepID=A0A241Y0E5_ACIPI|nr:MULTISPECIES: hypothetical protein [Acinetobacter]AVN16904.1 hypothetical protein C6N19_02400 [Acinetobacter pittii]AZB97929.1 hypothetical protein DKE45_001420 [Acinetobacter pittii]ENW14975.1 hypothetical protein F928_01076 [Acinetobacter pittii ATCC 19004 = CIP 70.29]KAI0679657.1 hypothetical protein A6010_09880 [Acinetobacter pittii]MBA0122694.1 hypothetical protein [Acinetobacter pittii]
MSPVEQGYMDVPFDQQSLLFTFGLSKVKNVYTHSLKSNVVLKTVLQHDHTKYHA